MQKCYANAGEVFGILNEYLSFGDLRMFTRTIGRSHVVMVYEWSFNVKRDKYNLSYSIKFEELEFISSVEALAERIKDLWNRDIQELRMKGAM